MKVPMPYQVTGSDWLSSKYTAMLADEQGLGKTLQTIMACQRIGARRILVVAPASVRTVWVREFAEAGLKAEVVTGAIYAQLMPDISIVSWDWIADYGIAATTGALWDVLVVDEAHYAKNQNSRRTRALLAASYAVGIDASGEKVMGKGVAHHARRVWALSGTPMPNEPSELWCWARTLKGTQWSFGQWVERFCVNVQTSSGTLRRTARSSTMKELNAVLKGFSLRRKKADVLKDLPPLWKQTLPLMLEPKDKWALENFAEESGFQFSDYNNPGAMLDALAKNVKHQSALRRKIGALKVKLFVPLIREQLENNAIDKVILFAVHKDVVYALEKGLAPFGVVKITGETTANARTEAVDKFQTDPSIRVFIGNIQAAGTGITLTAASTLYMVESSWVPGDNDQAMARPHRIGQTNAVTAITVVLADSIDEAVMNTLASKERAINTVVNK